MSRDVCFPNQSPYPGPWVKVLTGYLKNCFIILFVLISASSFGQVVLPPADIDCPSKDLEVTRAILPAPESNPCSCSGTRILQLGIINKTGSDRTSFAMWGKLIRKDASGNPVGSPEAIFACANGIKASSTNFYPTTTSITVACDQSLEIVDVILAWTSANKKETCDVLYNNPSTINPKCGRVDAIRIETGVDADFAVTDATCTSNGSVQVFPYGGVAPYKVKIGTDERTGIAAGGSTTFTNLPAGDYTILITDARPCSTSRNRPVLAPGSIDAPAATVTQPTCAVATGTVSVTNPDNTITYTLKQGGVIKYTAVDGSFNSVDPGTYDFIASKGICSASGDQVVVNSQPQTPATPSADVTQPTCTVATGAITVSNPDATITYTLTGPSPSTTAVSNSTGSFPGLAAGIYALTATKNGCTSPSVSKTVNAQPQTPSTPSADVTQPTCTVATGTISVSNPDATITYTLTGPSPSTTAVSNSTGSFPGLAAGTYALTATKNGCTSAPINKIVDQQPATPDAPSVCIIQPSLCGSAGSVTINSPTGVGFEYSIDNGATWSANNVFSNLGAGSVSGIKVKSPVGCISEAANCDVSDCSNQPLAERSASSSSTKTIASTTITTVEDAGDQVTVKAFPNPYNDKVRLVVSSPVAGQGSIEVVNMLGQKIKTVYQGRINAGNQAFDMSIPAAQRTTLIYIFRMGGKQITGKLLQLKQ